MVDTKVKGYTVSPDLLTNVHFGRGPEVVCLSSEDSLFLTDQNSRPILALRYEVIEERRGKVVIKSVQTPRGIEEEDIDQARKILGVHPHEFLIGHFLARTRYALNQHPDAFVVLSRHQIKHRSGQKPSLYQSLRDRFFDERYQLNPGKRRVQDLLGKDNEWLHRRQAIEAEASKLWR